ncbi:MAG: hypothetical protein IPJ69_11345 [Deltaproteobacteria bacterium]|nr:MAG: hypothetical protein IPJ69_11345 [Deltaproteobacteria bacterium]
MSKSFRIITLCLLIVFFSACGGRLPSAKRSHALTAKHFGKYGKKYKDTDFGKAKVSKVEIGDIKEMQKNMASVEAYVYLDNGTVHWVRLTCLKKTFGWKVLNWENLGTR